MNQQHGVDLSIWHDGAPTTKGADIAIVDARDSEVAPAACVVTADCLPILLWSTTEPVYGAVHAGRVGLEKGVIGVALDAFAELGATDLHAAVGPAICFDCYEVDRATASLWDQRDVSPQWTLNLVGRAVRELENTAEIALVSRFCTAHSRGWNSHRGDANGRRNAAYIWADLMSADDMPSVSCDFGPQLP